MRICVQLVFDAFAHKLLMPGACRLVVRLCIVEPSATADVLTQAV
jgi:hypothetical protein